MGTEAPKTSSGRDPSWRRLGWEFLRGIGSLGGTLVLVPLVVILFGNHWEWSRSLVPDSVLLVEPHADSTESTHTREVRLHFYDDGGDPGRGVALPPGSHLQIVLPSAVDRFRIIIQVDQNDIHEVLASQDGEEFAPLWLVPRGRRGSYLTTRRSSWLESDSPIRFLQVRAVGGNSPHAVAGLRLELEPFEVRHTILIPLLWGLALSLWAVSRTRRGGWADQLLKRWQRADLWLAAVLISAVLLWIPPGSLIVAAAILVIWVALWVLATWWSRSPASLLVVITVAFLLIWVVPRVFETLIVARIAELHDLTVDHRPLPGPDVNSDRIRFVGEASDIGDDEFVVFFSGDSFTYGLELEYEDAYPYVFEQLVSELECAQPIRSVNIGWTSASPLLSLRLVREIGYKYEPDLVIYNLDMTDFHDDLSYEAQLRTGGDLEIDPGEAAVLLLARNFPGVLRYVPDLQAIRRVFRGSETRETESSELSVPEDRFFVTNQPLEASVDDIERGVMKNLERLNLFVTETLGSSMALVVYPRAYQYSTREAARSWEASQYEVLGPYVRDPFDYFSRASERLPFPVLSLLAAFENSDAFPLFLEDDPHWNEAGARFVAAAVADWAVSSGLIPCLPASRR